MPERRSPLYDYHLRHGGRLIPGGGEFQFPVPTYAASESERRRAEQDWKVWSPWG